VPIAAGSTLQKNGTRARVDDGMSGTGIGLTSDTPIVFTHIPKTAGTSLRHALVAALDAAGSVHGYDRSLFGAFSGWGSIQPDLLSSIDYMDDGRLFPRNPRLVCGHFSARTTRSRFPCAPHITVLREGRSRVMSLWMFWRSRCHEEQAVWGEWGLHERKARQPLEEFLADPEVSSLTDNATVRALLWPHPLIPTNGPIEAQHDRQLLGEANRALQQYAFVDVIENPRWTANLGAWLGTKLDVGMSNVTPAMPHKLGGSLAGQLTPNALRSLNRLNRLDTQLWRSVARCSFPGESGKALGEASFVAAIASHSLRFAGVSIPA
jgi:hypothetical protein